MRYLMYDGSNGSFHVVDADGDSGLAEKGQDLLENIDNGDAELVKVETTHDGVQQFRRALVEKNEDSERFEVSDWKLIG